MYKRLLALGLFSLLVVFGACGDDDLATLPAAGARSIASAGRAARGGSGSGGRTTGNMAGQGGSSQTSIKCGLAKCVFPPAATGFMTPCCADQVTSTCGIMMNGSCVKPVAGDPRCPGLGFMGVIMIPSCCAQNGMCGLDASKFGTPGCTDLAIAARLAEWSLSPTDIPAARACDAASHNDADAGADAGS
jgi:hypothetical protein